MPPTSSTAGWTSHSFSAASPTHNLLFGAAALGAAAVFAITAQRRLGGTLLTPANVVTLSRAGAAAVLAAAPGKTVAWAALVAGATLADWLDGPLARRRGATPLGAVLDLEADSWLTLWAAIAAYRCGTLG